jgi:hypothetical protein
MSFIQNTVKMMSLPLHFCDTSNKHLHRVSRHCPFVARSSFDLLAVTRMFSRIFSQARASSVLCGCCTCISIHDRSDDFRIREVVA